MYSREHFKANHDKNQISPRQSFASLVRLPRENIGTGRKEPMQV